MEKKNNVIDMVNAEIEAQNKKILNYILMMLEEAWDTPPSEVRLQKLSHPEYKKNNAEADFIKEVAKHTSYSYLSVYQILRGKQKPSMNFCFAVIGFWNASPGRLSGKSCEPNVLISMREKLQSLEDKRRSELHASAADAFGKKTKRNSKGVA